MSWGSRSRLWATALVLAAFWPIQSVEAQARPTHVEFPQYPVMARYAQIQGKVEVRVHVTTDGTVEKAELMTGHQLLTTAALQSARSWRFPPSPQVRDFEIFFDFRLKKKRMRYPREKVRFESPNTAVIISNPPPMGGDWFPVVSEATAELLRLQNEFLATIRDGDPNKFLEYAGREGIYVGVDGPRMSPRDIQEEIRSRRGLYCLLFDTACLRRETRDPSLCSYKELLSSPQEVNAHTSTRMYGGKEQAEILVDVRVDTRNSRCGKPEPLDFIFNKEASEWRLVAIPYV